MPLLIEQIASTNVLPAGNIYFPGAIQLSDGRILAYWETGTGNYQAQLLTSDGVKIGGLIDIGTTSFSTAPSFTALPGGGFAAAVEFSGSGLDVALRIFSPTGQLLSSTTVNDVMSSDQDDAHITRLTGGNMVVVWRDSAALLGDPQPYSIKMKVFDANGVALTPETLVNTTTNGWQFQPSVTALQNNTYVAAWIDQSTGTSRSMFQLFDASGAKIGGETFVANTTLANVIALSNGNFELAGKIFDPQGQIVASLGGVLTNAYAIDGGFVYQSNNPVATIVYDNAGVLQSSIPGLAPPIGAGGTTFMGLSGRNLVIYREDDGIGGQIVPSQSSVSETAPENTVALNLSTASAALNSTFTYAYVSDSAGGAFRVENNHLVVADASKLDFETTPTIDVTLTSTDLNGNQYTTTITLNVADRQVEYRLVAEPEAEYVAGAHNDPQFTTLANGRTLELYVTSGAIDGQFYDSSFNKIGGQFALGNPDGQEFAPHGVALPGGGFAGIWQDGSDVVARFFDANGNPLGPRFEVPTNIVNTQRFADVALLTGGNLVVTWWDDNGLRAQLLSPSGAKIGGEISVNTFFGSLNAPHVVALSTGGFMVTWDNDGTAPENSGIRAQLFDASGVKVGSEFAYQSLVMNSSNDVSEPRFATLENGDIVSIWGQRENSAYSIHERRFSSAGALIGPDTLLVSGATNAEITALDGGGFAVMWTSTDPATYGVNASDRLFVQVFGADASALTAPFMVSSDNGILIADWKGELLPNGDLLVSWMEHPSLAVPDGEVKSRILDMSGGATAGDDHIIGTAAGDVFFARDGNDFLDLSQGGNDQAYGGAGNDAFFFGAALNAADHVDGGAGTNDQIGLQGDYTGANALVLGPNTITGIEAIVVLPGFSYDITTNDGNVAAGGTLKVQATQLAAGQNLTFNGAAEHDGSFLIFGGNGNDSLTGGAGNDGFYFGPSQFNASDAVNGGPGANDQLALDGDYTITLGGNLTGIEVVVLLHGPAGAPNHFNITAADSLVATGQTMTIFGLQVDTAITFDGSAEHDGAFRIYGGSGNDFLIGSDGNDWIFGGLGRDQLAGGQGNDTFYFDDVSQSTSAAPDDILDFTSDKIDVSGIDAIAGGANDAFVFIGSNAFSHNAGELRLQLDVGFQWLVQGDTDGDGVANFTLIVHSDVNGITSANFIL